MTEQEKQIIEEMAKAICHAPTCKIRENGGTCYKYCKAYIYAFRTVNAGYRLASDVAREIFEEIGELVNEYLDGRIYTHDFCTYLAELKKKYKEG